MPEPIRALTLCLPELGGVYVVVAGLVKSLAARGVTLSWLAAHHALRVTDPDDLRTGALLATPDDDDLTRARALFERIAAERPHLVLFHALSGAVESNLARYLPPEIFRVLVVHSITPATYKAAAALRDHVHATICVSPRIHSDLTGRHGFDPLWTFVVPNGIDPAAYAIPRPLRDCNALHVLCHGRIDDAVKGVFWLPEIMARAARAGADLRLTVSGDGPDLAALKQRFQAAGLSGRVRFTGPVPRRAIPAHMAEHEALLLPSRFEGCSVTLLEAMAAGCVPIASRIRDVTDFLVRDEIDGLLFAPGSVRRASAHLARLASDPAAASLLSRSARMTALRFTLRRQAEHYASIFALVLDHARETAPPLDMEAWSLPPGLRPGLRSSLPQPVKNILRVARERIPLF